MPLSLLFDVTPMVPLRRHLHHHHHRTLSRRHMRSRSRRRRRRRRRRHHSTRHTRRHHHRRRRRMKTDRRMGFIIISIFHVWMNFLSCPRKLSRIQKCGDSKRHFCVWGALIYCIVWDTRPNAWLDGWMLRGRARRRDAADGDLRREIDRQKILSFEKWFEAGRRCVRFRRLR